MRQMEELTQDEYEHLCILFSMFDGWYQKKSGRLDSWKIKSALNKVLLAVQPAYLPTRAEYEAVAEQSGAGSRSAYNAIVEAKGDIDLAVSLLRETWSKPVVTLKFRKEDEDE